MRENSDAVTGQNSRSIRILYLYPDTMGPSPDSRRNALAHLSSTLSGVFAAVFVPTGAELKRVMQSTEKSVGCFCVLPIGSQARPKPLRKLLEFLQLCIAPAKLPRSERRFDAIVAHGAYRTGLAGLVLSITRRVPLIVELPGHPTRGLALDRSLAGRLKSMIAPRFLRLVLGHASRIRMLYPTQLAGVWDNSPTSLLAKSEYFHEFVPVSLINRGAARQEFLLFVGFPFHLKGVDTLIDAFHAIKHEFPNLSLRIVGYCPDLDWWRSRAGDCPRIEFLAPKPNEEVAELMRTCRAFILPSRTEAMGRVLLEAMAAGAPVIASRVDGIPYYVEDGKTGLLFNPGDADELADKIRVTLTQTHQTELRTDTAAEVVHREYSEAEYVRRFTACVEAAVHPFLGKRSS